jgi:hypothetical protein
MHWILRRVTYANVAATLALFVALGGTAYAANGGSFLLGRSNAASASTSLSDSGSSPVLKLLAKSGQPPIATNSNKKVGNLNADLLDGVSAEKFAQTKGRTGIIVGDVGDTDGLEETARCPAGTIMTGGGGFAYGDGEHLAYSGPDIDGDTLVVIPNSWLAFGDISTVAFATCYNPVGSVPGAFTGFAAASASAARPNGASRTGALQKKVAAALNR